MSQRPGKLVVHRGRLWYISGVAQRGALVGHHNVLIIDNSVRPDLYTPVSHWRRLGIQNLEFCRMLNSEGPGDLSRFTHVIVTGSEASITSSEPWIDAACGLVAKVVARSIPCLASCFGHQMLARALAGCNYVRRSPTPEFGWVDVNLCDSAAGDPLLGPSGGSFSTYSAHFDEIWPLPAGFVTLGRSSRCEHAAVRLDGLPVWGLQHHPEIDPDEGAALLSALRQTMPDRLALIDSGLQPEVRESWEGRRIVERFLTL